MTFELVESTGSTLEISPDATSSSTPTNGEPRIPLTIPSAQEYYWHFAWQSDERETLAGLDEGEYADFDSDDPEDAARWLREPDDDE